MTSGGPPGRPVVLDTNVVSELMRAVPDARVAEWMRGVLPSTVCTTSVTLAEVLYGIARLPTGRRRDHLHDAAADVFGSFADRVLAFDAAAANQYADIVNEREEAGAPIAGFDAQIAAICRSHEARLATRNPDDFSGLGIDLIDPWLTG